MTDRHNDDQKFEEMIRKEAAYWDRNARSESSEYDFFGVWRDAIVNEVFYDEEINECYRKAQASSGRILELGCGRGGDAIQLALHGNTVDALDLSQENLKVARMNYENAKKKYPSLGNVNFIAGDLNRIAFEENIYDCVFAKSTLPLVWHLEDLMQEVQKTMKPQGSLIIFDEVGMHRLTSLVASILVFVLPTTRSYRDKIKLKGKGTALRHLLTPGESPQAGSGGNPAYGWRSPFDSVSRTKLIGVVEKYFTAVDIKHFNFIMHYLLPRLKVPKTYKRRLCSFFHTIDTFAVKIVPRLGEYVRIFAVNAK
jgi:ubiquinone/menaquinone biosynthesis C-methylase UbiE